MLPREFLFGRLVPDANDPRFVRVVAIIALIARLTLGLGLLTSGLASLMGGNNGMGGLMGIPYRGVGMGMGNANGMEALLSAQPYLQLAVGLGIMLGAFTFVWTVVSALLALVPNLLMCLTLVINSGLNNMQSNMYLGSMMVSGLIFARTDVLSTVLVLLLSHHTINRFSVDSLIFAAPPKFPQPPGMPQPTLENYPPEQTIAE